MPEKKRSLARKKVKEASYTPLQDVCFRFYRNKAAMVGLIIIVVLVFVAIFANLLVDYNKDVIAMDVANKFQRPSAQHWFGTDNAGRDLFSRILYGTRYSLSFGIVCTLIMIVGGSIIGAAAAYAGGWVDSLLMRAGDSIMCIPEILLTLSLVSVLGTGLNSLIIAIGFGSIPGFARVVRSVVLTIVQMDYVEAARASGVRSFNIIVGQDRKSVV